MTFQRVGILMQPQIEMVQPLARDIHHLLVEGGHPPPWRCSAWDEEAMRAHIPGSTLLITLGGDGTILRTSRLAVPYGIPILGVKLGRIGFLAEVRPESWQPSLTQLLAHRYWLEERMLLRVRIERGGETLLDIPDALNDAVVGRGSLARLVRVAAYLDEGYLTTYVADGVIVSTPTGSTAYALAAGGPILPPELKNILLLPIAPHLSMDRSVVLGQGATVRLKVSTDHRAILTMDGQIEFKLLDSDEVVITVSSNTSRFVRLRERNYFYQSLMEKLKWVG